jgi:phosphoribosylanthranilate isomerase
MRTKICGITNLDDANLCITEGAHALGFIFASISPRAISKEQCRNIISSLPPFCERVGVFVDEKPEIIQQTVKFCHLSMVQLHGTSENFDYIKDLYGRLDVPIIRAIRVGDNLNEFNFGKDFPKDYLSAILIDSKDKQPVNLNLAKTIQETLKLPIILAGALNKNNILDVLQNSHPDAIDLCSSLEARPGQKDPQKVKSFMKLVRII